MILEKGKISKFGKIPNKDLLQSPVLQTPDALFGMEIFQSYGMAVGKEVFETAYWIGRFFEQMKTDKLWPVYRTEVKLHVCGTVRAKDSTVRESMIKRWGEPGKPRDPGPTFGVTDDVWSALAIATTVFDWSKKQKPLPAHPAFAK